MKVGWKSLKKRPNFPNFYRNLDLKESQKLSLKESQSNTIVLALDLASDFHVGNPWKRISCLFGAGYSYRVSKKSFVLEGTYTLKSLQ